MQRDLVVRAQGGDVDAFSALTAGSTQRLYSVARLILRDNERAADVVQDALLRAWLDIRGLRDPERFDAWLHRLLVRACYRAAGRHRSHEVAELRVASTAETSTADPQASVAARDQLDRGFRCLTPEQRAVIALHHYLGLSLSESAEVLGIPLGTVQSRLNRATAALRAALEADDRPTAVVAEAIR
jgi:RNA polymerase sigma-70 factor (ECF subfamily)